jgi:hypothetical protein
LVITVYRLSWCTTALPPMYSITAESPVLSSSDTCSVVTAPFGSTNGSIWNLKDFCASTASATVA